MGPCYRDRISRNRESRGRTPGKIGNKKKKGLKPPWWLSPVRGHTFCRAIGSPLFCATAAATCVALVSSRVLGIQEDDRSGSVPDREGGFSLLCDGWRIRPIVMHCPRRGLCALVNARNGAAESGLFLCVAPCSSFCSPGQASLESRRGSAFCYRLVLRFVPRGDISRKRSVCHPVGKIICFFMHSSLAVLFFLIFFLFGIDYFSEALNLIN